MANVNILLELFWTFLKVNLLSTSGPASVGLLYHEAVGKFVTEQQFVQAVGFSSVLPGSDALQLAMYVGYAAHGFLGGLVALTASILPPTLIILGVTMILHRLRREAWISNFVEGLTPAIAVLMVFTAWKIFQKGGNTGWFGWSLALVSFLAMWFKLPERAVIILAGVVGIIFLSP
ncbi:MAG: chromate transporter [Anaerolineales bacterium]|nr:chromate transporter [Anaerolineales bacterium]MCZ2123137.1 chromate transporter [Anaerolineales bacterium]